MYVSTYDAIYFIFFLLPTSFFKKKMYNVNLVLVKWFNNYKYAYVSEKIPVYAEVERNV